MGYDALKECLIGGYEGLVVVVPWKNRGNEGMVREGRNVWTKVGRKEEWREGRDGQRRKNRGKEGMVREGRNEWMEVGRKEE